MSTSLPPYEAARQRGQQDLVDTILALAVDILITDGAHALSMRRLAMAAGCSTTVLYTLFGGKNGIIDALFQDGFRRLAAAQHVALSVQDSAPLDAVLRLCRAYRATALAYPTHYMIMFGSPVPDYQPSPESKQMGLEGVQVLADAIARLPHMDDAPRRAMLVWSAVHGLVSIELAGMHLYPDDAEQMLEDVVLRILGPTASSP